MTTLIRQRSGSDCVLASIAMASGSIFWQDIFTEEDLADVIKSQGVSTGSEDFTKYMKKAGFKEADYKRLPWLENVPHDKLCSLLWGRRALLSINSLNNPGGSHMIYWDGTRVWDPQEGVEGKQAAPFLSSSVVTGAVLLR